MAEIQQLSFSKNWMSAADFPTVEPNEQQARADMQCLFDEIKGYINDKLIPGVGDISKIERMSFDIETRTLQIWQNGSVKAVEVPVPESGSVDVSGLVSSVTYDADTHTLSVTKGGQKTEYTLASASSGSTSSDGSAPALSSEEVVNECTKAAVNNVNVMSQAICDIRLRKYGQVVQIKGDVFFDISSNTGQSTVAAVSILPQAGKPVLPVYCEGRVYTQSAFNTGAQTDKGWPCLVELSPMSTGGSFIVGFGIRGGYQFTAGEHYVIKFGCTYLTAKT